MLATGMQVHKFLEGGRGLGKSSILAWRIKDIAIKMPRSANVIVGESYIQIITRTLPSTIEGLARLGYHKDIHYFVGRKPPKAWKWPEPYQPPLAYDHFMIWYTGAGFHFVSQDRPGSGRGLNTDSVTGDEMQLLKYDDLFHDVLATNRSNKDKPYANLPIHHSTMFVGTIPWNTRGKWLYKMEELAQANPKEYLYIRAPSEFNREVLGDEWFKNMERELPPLIYNGEIKCIRPTKIEGGFYPLLNEQVHYYASSNYRYLDSLGFDFSKVTDLDCRADGDIDMNRPFDIACDWGAHINTLVVRQEHSRNGFIESRAVNALFVKTPKRLQDLAAMFCDYYEAKTKKEVNFYYDHTAVFTDASRPTSFADEFMAVLRKRGWTVVPHYIGQAASHHTRYLFWGMAHSEADERLPRIRYNERNCKYLLLSKQNAGVLQGRNGFEKDKRAERDINAAQEETTHFSDADDTLCYGKYGKLMNSGSVSNYIPETMM
ncbi:hypothetical protein SAMN05421780_108194 [Flexibacter flexilis DSM 6793]|uniref:Uncharacterized protein n=2 Tax=Flexibacter flexilis TaxID=998 RepID=A0A1I1LEI0_9BACT|nr:hypothetical protein SAMN05421780_108194 [Flexibacter flexilis DSM 6793]